MNSQQSIVGNIREVASVPTGYERLVDVAKRANVSADFILRRVGAGAFVRRCDEIFIDPKRAGQLSQRVG